MPDKGPKPRLSEKAAFAIITKALRKNPRLKTWKIAGLLTEAGGAESTAYRQISRYFKKGAGDELLPEEREARVRFILVTQDEILSTDVGKVNPYTLKLYGEATGVIAPASESADDGIRLAHAVEAIAKLRGLQEIAQEGEENE